MPGLILFGAFAASALMAFVGNWVTLKSWRLAKGSHWTEQARLCYPVRAAAATNSLIIPAAVVLGCAVVSRDEMPGWWLVGLCAWVGSTAGTIPMNREVFPRIPTRELLRSMAVSWLMRLPIWGVLIGAAVAMPPELNDKAWIEFAAVVLFLVIWSYDGWLRLGKAMGIVQVAGDTLQSIVRDLSQKTNVTVRAALVIRSEIAAAYALPATKTLLFTTRALQVLSTDELRAVCAHELAHLGESRVIVLLRHVNWLVFLPWVFVKPVFRADNAGIFILVLTSLGVQQVMFRVSRRLEKRADAMAVEAESEAGVYARALVRLHEDSLIPAVMARAGTHPNLYDRMIAAGITPDFPKPKAAQHWAGNGWFFWILFVVLLGIWLGESAADNW